MGSAKVFYAKRGASMNKRGCLIKKAPYSKHFQCFFNKYLYLQNKTTNRKIQFIGVGTGVPDGPRSKKFCFFSGYKQ